jgi:hypothetical protein
LAQDVPNFFEIKKPDVTAFIDLQNYPERRTEIHVVSNKMVVEEIHLKSISAYYYIDNC